MLQRVSNRRMYNINIIDDGYNGRAAWTTDMLHQMLSEHYPTLKNERWDVDVDTIRTSPILHPILKKSFQLVSKNSPVFCSRSRQQLLENL